MFCKLCRDNTTCSDTSSTFVSGSQNFKIESVRSHQSSTGHTHVAAAKVAERSAVVMAVGRYSLTSVLLLCFLGSQPLLGQKIDWNCFPADSPCCYATHFVRGILNNPPELQLQQKMRLIRHLVSASAPRGRKYLASRIGYYTNSDCTFHQARLLTSGDVSLNPGALFA